MQSQPVNSIRTASHGTIPLELNASFLSKFLKNMRCFIRKQHRT
ncbi:hypothetical protein EVA_20949 [gut metagenome]|uniref:Uncharacterized protein n=1 Tax=gut metagenome TaxID=749906 RepID=J9FU90_9ZZZZ